MANLTLSSVIIKDILEGRKEFLSLDFSDPLEREIAIDCIKEKEEFIYLLNASDKDQGIVLLTYISLAKDREEKYQRIFKLLRKQLDKNIVDFYLNEKFEEGRAKFENVLDIYKGFTSSVILSYDYETKEGETLCYFDKALGVPAKLRVLANFKLKLIDSVKLIKKLDVALTSITLDNIMNMISNDINRLLRDTLLPIIEDEGLSYYQLSRNYTKLGKAIIKKSEEILGEGGIEVSEILIRDIALSNNAGKMLEEQYFAIAEAERVKEFENRVEEASLALYEKKAIIHEKYPNFPVSLTEAEKDFAFDRYLRKENKGKVYSTKLDEIKLEYRDRPEKIVKGKEDIIVPKEPLMPKAMKGVVPYAIIFALCIIASVVAILFVEPQTIGLIALGGSVVVFGIIGFIMAMVTSKNRRLFPSKKEYKKLYDEYQQQLEKYQEKKEEIIKAEN